MYCSVFIQRLCGGHQLLFNIVENDYLLLLLLLFYYFFILYYYYYIILIQYLTMKGKLTLLLATKNRVSYHDNT